MSKKFENLVAAALDSLFRCDAVLRGTHRIQYETLAAIYRLHVWFRDHPTDRDSFYQANKIIVHGGVTEPELSPDPPSDWSCRAEVRAGNQG